MEGKLLKLIVTQEEMYDLGNIANIKHYILYDPENKIAVDITAEVEQAPLLSECLPYDVVRDATVLDKLLSGEIKPIPEGFRKSGRGPGITGFESQELIGPEYDGVRYAMTKLKDARKTLDETINSMRSYCLSANLVIEKPSRQKLR